MIALMMIAAHMAGDFLFQTQWIAENKMKNPLVLWLHCYIYTLCFIPVTVYAHYHQGLEYVYGFIMAIFATHMLIDWRKWASGRYWTPKPILVDQTLHAITLAFLAYLFFNP